MLNLSGSAPVHAVMRKLIVSLIVVAAVGVAAAQAFAAARSVRVGDNFFLRRGHHTLTVSRGSTVRFHWVGGNVHDVHAKRGPVHFRSPFMTSGTFSHRFTRSGRYLIVCDVHRHMRLTIRVR